MSRWRRRLALPAMLTVSVLAAACGDRTAPPDARDPALASTDDAPPEDAAADDANHAPPDAAPPLDAPPDAVG